MTKQHITVTAKCPKCKKTKKYSSDEPPKHTPYCPHGCMMPMFITKVDIKTTKTNGKITKSRRQGSRNGSRVADAPTIRPKSSKAK